MNHIRIVQIFSSFTFNISSVPINAVGLFIVVERERSILLLLSLFLVMDVES